MSDITNRFDSLNAAYGEAISQSIDIDNCDYSGVDRQISEIIAKFANRVNVVDSLIRRDYPTLGIESTTAQSGQQNIIARRVDMTGRDFTGIDTKALPSGIYIEKRADGSVRKRIVANKGRF